MSKSKNKNNNFYLQSAETSTSSLAKPPSQTHSRSTSKAALGTVEQTPTTAAAAGGEDGGGQRALAATTYETAATFSSPSQHFANDYEDQGSSDSEDDTSLPFPAPLPRSDFLGPSFDPSAYLSTLAATRYQTLEDLRVELRTRSQQLNQELLELVNTHHEDFIHLGRSLKGGEDKVEEVRVGVMGFKREVEDVRRKLVDRERAVGTLLATRKRICTEMELGRRCVDLNERIELLEDRLGVRTAAAAAAATAATEAAKTGHENPDEENQHSEYDPDDEDYDDDEEHDDQEEDEDDEDTREPRTGEQQGAPAMSIAKVRKRTQDLIGIERLATRIGRDHPFINAQQERLAKLRATLLLDLGALLKHLKSNPSPTSSSSSSSAADRKLQVLALYRALDASKAAVEILHESS